MDQKDLVAEKAIVPNWNYVNVVHTRHIPSSQSDLEVPAEGDALPINSQASFRNLSATTQTINGRVSGAVGADGFTIGATITATVAAGDTAVVSGAFLGQGVMYETGGGEWVVEHRQVVRRRNDE